MPDPMASAAAVQSEQPTKQALARMQTVEQIPLRARSGNHEVRLRHTYTFHHAYMHTHGENPAGSRRVLVLQSGTAAVGSA